MNTSGLPVTVVTCVPPTNMFLHLSRKRKYIYCFSVLFGVLCFVSYRANDKISQPLDLPHVVVHLDFKGSPPKLSYLTSILGLLREHGANGLLLEYEDMFPFEGPLQHLNANNVYSRKQLKEFITEAVQLGFTVIPLVQTFGHMQHVLKHDQHKLQRENLNLTDSICPSQPQSKALLEAVLFQVVHFHSKISPLKYIHVGCDEVFTLNSCQYCKQRNSTDFEIFRHHVQFVYNTVQRITPGTEVLIWDDMLRGKKEDLLDPMQLPIDLVAWHYHVEVDVSYVDLYRYKKNFNNVWAATAFKGADGSDSLLPDLPKRILNHFSWMQFLDKYRRLVGQMRPGFRGIILTGWSRYSHDAPVCDLLPASLPSLIINLILVKRFKEERFSYLALTTWSNFYEVYLKQNVDVALSCDVTKIGENDIDGLNCSYQGSDLNSGLKTFIDLKRKIGDHDSIMNKLLKRNDLMYIEVENIKDVLLKDTFKLQTKLINTENVLRHAMSRYFDTPIFVSYLNQIIEPTKILLTNAYHKISAMNHVSNYSLVKHDNL